MQCVICMWSTQSFTSCMHPVALFIYLLCLCLTFLKLAPQGELPSCSTRRGRVSALAATVQGHWTLVHTRWKHFLDPCHSAGVMECHSRANLSAPPWPWHIYSTWHFLTQRVGLIWLSVSKGWMAGRLALPSGSWGSQEKTLSAIKTVGFINIKSLDTYSRCKVACKSHNTQQNLQMKMKVTTTHSRTDYTRVACGACNKRMWQQALTNWHIAVKKPQHNRSNINNKTKTFIKTKQGSIQRTFMRGCVKQVKNNLI